MESLTNGSSINIRVDKEVKEEVSKLYEDLGLNISTAVNMFFRQCLNKQGIPFAIERLTYKDELLDAIQEADEIVSGKIKKKSYNSAKEMTEDILNENKK